MQGEIIEPHLKTLRLPNNRKMELGSRTMIMGILNVTPDSFSDGGRYLDLEAAVKHALEMIEAGADIIDIGGASSRPNSIMASTDEEIRRIMPVIERLRREDIVISVDTFRAQVASAALEAGADIINDIGGLQLDPGLADVLSTYGVPAVLMHNRMQLNAGKPYQDIIVDIMAELKHSLDRAVAAGVNENQLIIDPGIGFVQSAAHDRLIIKRLTEFKNLGKPILVGTSRKSFIGQTLNLEVEDRLEGSLATVVMAIMNGADIVRVHDVKASRRAAQMTDAVMKENG
ncbi:MAG TPA: dihydropteroate synthase [Syntrophomonadaceae bacterium]|nr:dihydropteroate synthase [Syntrophomonadaceae bacterium]